MKNQMSKYELDSSRLDIKQGFAYLSKNKDIQQDEQMVQLTQALAAKEEEEKKLRSTLDSMLKVNQLGSQLYAELKAQQPSLTNAIVQPSTLISDSTKRTTTMVVLSLSSRLSKLEKTRLENWLKARLRQSDLLLLIR